MLSVAQSQSRWELVYLETRAASSNKDNSIQYNNYKELLFLDLQYVTLHNANWSLLQMIFKKKVLLSNRSIFSPSATAVCAV